MTDHFYSGKGIIKKQIKFAASKKIYLIYSASLRNLMPKISNMAVLK